MKTLILTLLLTLSLQVLAKSDSPMGLFQVDSSLSKVTLFEEGQKLSGFIDIRKEFGDSKLKLESPNISFESVEVTGTIENFEIKGYLTHSNESRYVTLKGKYFGMVDLDRGQQKIAITLSSDPILMRVFAAKPAETMTAIHKEVQDIYQ